MSRKERLLTKYLDKKRKQRNRDDLYSQILALNRPKDANEVNDHVSDSHVESGDDDSSESEECPVEECSMENESSDTDGISEGDDTPGINDIVIGSEVILDDNVKSDDEERIDLKEYETRVFGNRRCDIEEYRKTLPIYYEQAEIIHCVRRSSILFVQGAAGCGKTTQIPQFLYEGGFTINGMIGVTQPRRISAVSISNRINEETNENVCGYKIKYESSVTPSTRIQVMTDGVLVREIREDFLLSKYSVIILDEIHERNTNIDLLISILPRIMKMRRERGNELKLVLMSATGSVDEFKEFFGDMNVFTCPEQTFKVDVFYEEKTEIDYLNIAYERIKKIILSSRSFKKRKMKDIIIGLNDDDAAILVFLASKQDIYLLKNRLDDSNLDVTVIPLHSSLGRSEQDLVFEKTINRKIILSTNIAETSITIPDVVFVVDSGKVKNRAVDSEGLVKYSVDFITKSSAIQRMGRAGRTRPGICYRLYSGKAYEMFHDSIEPQILREPVDDVVLNLLSLGITAVHRFPFISHPGIKAINGAITRLQGLGAVDASMKLTEEGRMMSKYPVEPRLARLLCHGDDDVFVELVAVVSLISCNTEIHRNNENQRYFEGSKSDFLVQLNIYNDFIRSKNKRGFCHKMNLNYNTAVEITKMITHLLKLSHPVERGISLDLSSEALLKVRNIIYRGFVDHLAIPSSNTHIFRTDEVQVSSNSISIESNQYVVFENLISRGNRLYMRNITVVDDDWF